MKNFKKLHHKEGLSYIEVVAAITIFTLFGTALFLSQNYLFQRIAVAQWQMLAYNRMQLVMNEYKMEQIKNVLEKKTGEVKYEKKFEAPDMTIKITEVDKVAVKQQGVGDDKQEESFLEKYEQIKAVKMTVLENEQERLSQYSFIYVPDFSDEDAS